MTSFKDAKDRDYTVDVTIGAFKRVKDTLGIDLYEIETGDPPLATRLQTDIELLVNIVYVVCKPQADAHQVNDVEFGEALDGDAFLAARNAFLEALIDFFRKCQRQDRATALAKAKAVLDAAVQMSERRVEAIDADALLRAAEAAIDERIQRSNEPFGSSPASSASIHVPLHFASSALCPKDDSASVGSTPRA